jgi:hypothetical protein
VEIRKLELEYRAQEGRRRIKSQPAKVRLFLRLKKSRTTTSHSPLFMNVDLAGTTVVFMRIVCDISIVGTVVQDMIIRWTKKKSKDACAPTFVVDLVVSVDFHLV